MTSKEAIERAIKQYKDLEYLVSVSDLTKWDFNSVAFLSFDFLDESPLEEKEEVLCAYDREKRKQSTDLKIKDIECYYCPLTAFDPSYVGCNNTPYIEFLRANTKEDWINAIRGMISLLEDLNSK